ncbi:putative dye-decolorizing peroxidase (DyP)YfeX-like subgroup [Salmonella sp. NCTC 11881]|nr:putative dye-decolorizing peroxidase (DyP)YfeX-like subgroup [Salmonella sp. NCTC 11881]
MSQVQSGILPEHCRAAIWIEANVKGDLDALRAASRTFADKTGDLRSQISGRPSWGRCGVWQTIPGVP